MRLGPDEFGRKHGVTSRQAFAQNWMPLFPPIIAFFMARSLLRGWPAFVAPAVKWLPASLPNAPSVAMDLLVGYVSLSISVGSAVYIIPSSVSFTRSRGFVPSEKCSRALGSLPCSKVHGMENV
jgi:hypothetical protein